MVTILAVRDYDTYFFKYHCGYRVFLSACSSEASLMNSKAYTCQYLLQHQLPLSHISPLMSHFSSSILPNRRSVIPTVGRKLLIPLKFFNLFSTETSLTNTCEPVRHRASDRHRLTKCFLQARLLLRVMTL